MKIGPFQIGRVATLADAPSSAAVKEAGASGTINQSGWLVDDEYNSDLAGRQGLEAFRRMIDSDGSTREAWLHIRAPLMNADWDVEPASDDPLHLEQAALLHRALFDFPTRSFRNVLPTLLKYLPQGFQLFELPETVVRAELSWADPATDEPVTAAARDFVVWEYFAHRKPETVWKWNANGGRLESVVQYAFKDDGFRELTIDADQLLVLTNDQEGDDFTGQSILRAAYKAWYLKELVEKINAIAVERHGVGINVVYVPGSRANDEALIDRLEQMLGDLSAGERPYLIIPGPKGQASGTDAEGGFWFEVVTPGSQASDNTPFLTYLRGEIKGSMLVRFSELGHGQTGARATGDVQSKVWYDVLHGVADHISDTFRPHFRRLLEKNYANVDELPKLVARNIDARSLTEFADSVSKLAVADLILPDKSARNAVRNAAGLPDEDDDAAEQLGRLEQAKMPPQPAGTEPLNAGGDGGGAAVAVALATQIAERLDGLAETVTDARRKDDREASATALRELGLLLRSMPQPAVTIETQPREYHAHKHDHEHIERIDEERLREIFSAVTEESRQPEAARQEIERNDRGHAIRVTQYDAEGAVLRTRKVVTDDDGNITGLEEE